jgi:hypothetical protein
LLLLLLLCVCRGVRRCRCRWWCGCCCCYRGAATVDVVSACVYVLCLDAEASSLSLAFCFAVFIQLAAAEAPGLQLAFVSLSALPQPPPMATVLYISSCARLYNNYVSGEFKLVRVSLDSTSINIAYANYNDTNSNTTIANDSNMPYHRQDPEGPKIYQDHQGGKQKEGFIKHIFGPQWPLGVVSRGDRHCNMTSISSPSFCSAELPGRPILRAIRDQFIFGETPFLFPPWWSWYVLGPSDPHQRQPQHYASHAFAATLRLWHLLLWWILAVIIECPTVLTTIARPASLLCL